MTSSPLGCPPYATPLEEAALVTEMTIGKLRDLVRAGLLPCLLYPDRSTGCSEWFTIEDLRHVRTQAKNLPNEEMETRRIHDTSDAVRAYLEICPPVSDYDRAIEESWPVLSRSRSGRLYAHVQADVLARFAMENLPDKPNAWFPASVNWALKAMGAVQTRGLRPLSGGPQRWHMWWRLPQGMWSASPELASLLMSGLTAREDDEPLTVTRDRKSSYLRDPMRTMAD